MPLLRPVAAVVAVVAFSACYDSTVTDDGPVITFDASPGARDGGPPDAPTPARDLGPRPRDAGPTLDAGSACEVGEVLGPFPGPRCTAETTECLQSCESEPDIEDCQDGCFATDPACVTCLNETVIRCINANGCQEPWDGVACCTEERCPGLTGAARLDCGGCFGEVEGYFECANASAIDVCEDAFLECFEP